jgi:hypothetical protein
MSETPSVDYNAVLADLRAKRATLDAAIAGIEAMLGLRASTGIDSAADAPQSPANGNNGTLGPGAFLGLTIVEAAKKLLGHERRNMKTEEILYALTQGGLVLKGESPINVVGSVLNRNFGAGGDIVKVSRGVWGLASWHPRLRKKAPDAKGVLAVDANPTDDDNPDEKGA